MQFPKRPLGALGRVCICLISQQLVLAVQQAVSQSDPGSKTLKISRKISQGSVMNMWTLNAGTLLYLSLLLVNGYQKENHTF